MVYAGLPASVQTCSTGAWDSFLSHIETSGARELFVDWLKPTLPTPVLARWFLPWLHWLSRRDLDQDKNLVPGVDSLVKAGSPKSQGLCSTGNVCLEPLLNSSHWRVSLFEARPTGRCGDLQKVCIRLRRTSTGNTQSSPVSALEICWLWVAWWETPLFPGGRDLNLLFVAESCLCRSCRVDKWQHLQEHNVQMGMLAKIAYK